MQGSTPVSGLRPPSSIFSDDGGGFLFADDLLHAPPFGVFSADSQQQSTDGYVGHSSSDDYEFLLTTLAQFDDRAVPPPNRTSRSNRKSQPISQAMSLPSGNSHWNSNRALRGHEDENVETLMTHQKQYRETIRLQQAGLYCDSMSPANKLSRSKSKRKSTSNRNQKAYSPTVSSYPPTAPSQASYPQVCPTQSTDIQQEPYRRSYNSLLNPSINIDHIGHNVEPMHPRHDPSLTCTDDLDSLFTLEHDSVWVESVMNLNHSLDGCAPNSSIDGVIDSKHLPASILNSSECHQTIQMRSDEDVFVGGQQNKLNIDFSDIMDTFGSCENQSFSRYSWQPTGQDHISGINENDPASLTSSLDCAIESLIGSLSEKTEVQVHHVSSNLKVENKDVVEGTDDSLDVNPVEETAPICDPPQLNPIHTGTHSSSLRYNSDGSEHHGSSTQTLIALPPSSSMSNLENTQEEQLSHSSSASPTDSLPLQDPTGLMRSVEQQDPMDHSSVGNAEGVPSGDAALLSISSEPQDIKVEIGPTAMRPPSSSDDPVQPPSAEAFFSCIEHTNAEVKVDHSLAEDSSPSTPLDQSAAASDPRRDLTGQPPTSDSAPTRGVTPRIRTEKVTVDGSTVVRRYMVARDRQHRTKKVYLKMRHESILTARPKDCLLQNDIEQQQQQQQPQSSLTSRLIHCDAEPRPPSDSNESISSSRQPSTDEQHSLQQQQQHRVAPAASLHQNYLTREQITSKLQDSSARSVYSGQQPLSSSIEDDRFHSLSTLPSSLGDPFKGLPSEDGLSSSHQTSAEPYTVDNSTLQQQHPHLISTPSSPSFHTNPNSGVSILCDRDEDNRSKFMFEEVLSDQGDRLQPLQICGQTNVDDNDHRLWYNSEETRGNAIGGDYGQQNVDDNFDHSSFIDIMIDDTFMSEQHITHPTPHCGFPPSNPQHLDDGGLYRTETSLQAKLEVDDKRLKRQTVSNGDDEHAVTMTQLRLEKRGPPTSVQMNSKKTRRLKLPDRDLTSQQCVQNHAKSHNTGDQDTTPSGAACYSENDESLSFTNCHSATVATTSSSLGTLGGFQNPNNYIGGDDFDLYGERLHSAQMMEDSSESMPLKENHRVLDDILSAFPAQTHQVTDDGKWNDAFVLRPNSRALHAGKDNHHVSSTTSISNGSNAGCWEHHKQLQHHQSETSSSNILDLHPCSSSLDDNYSCPFYLMSDCDEDDSDSGCHSDYSILEDPIRPDLSLSQRFIVPSQLMSAIQSPLDNLRALAARSHCN
eukprot:GHVH01011836.1.p1 GENE.GHVH01011836.1~~GHVH01011836.1.p1  ORF type:complete len:1259 (+),score=207.93 GHVH01011836.1:280-4056(+)